MTVDKQMSEAVQLADSIDSVTPSEWDVLNRDVAASHHLRAPCPPV